MNGSLDSFSCKSNNSRNWGMFTNVSNSISSRLAGEITHDDIIPRVKDKRGRNRLLNGEIEDKDIKETENDWLLAHKEVCQWRLNMNVPYIFLNAKDYQIETSQHKMVFRVDDTETGDAYLWFKSCTNMLHPDYADELSRRFEALENISGLGITFTKKSSPYLSVKHDYDVLMRAFNSIVNKIINLRWVVAYHTVNCKKVVDVKGKYHFVGGKKVVDREEKYHFVGGKKVVDVKGKYHFVGRKKVVDKEEKYHFVGGKKVVDKEETKRLRAKKREEIKALNKSMGLNSDKIEWFRVSEVGKSNYMCHIHAIFYGLRFIPIEWLKKEWHKLTGDSYMVWVSKRNKKASKHAVKYLTKNISPKHDLSLSLVMLWALNARAWGCSRSLLTKIHKHDKKIILDDMGLSDEPRYTVKCLGLYLGGEYSGVYKILEDPPPNSEGGAWGLNDG